ncbi:fructosamine kinase family protein [Citreimonas sp.]|uniref:fructosamine kinase family protein n=1 Tax=Citreimonas sp. TaxID=3036715 RepID=UPI00405993F6
MRWRTEITWRDEVEQVFGSPIAGVRTLPGGDLSAIARVELEDGTHLVTKRGPLVGTEARMLEAMRLAGAQVARVEHLGGRLLCLAWEDASEPDADGWASLGAALRSIHGSTNSTYGWPEDYAFGDILIDNGPRETWPEFWAEARLLPQIPHMPGPLRPRIEALCKALPDRLPERPDAALLHGDLWGGNILFTERGAVMIDPACYYGHAEVDLAMLSLFGTPEPSFADAYGPAEPDAETRRPIYQLWPAMVHYRLHGDRYADMLERVLGEAAV